MTLLAALAESPPVDIVLLVTQMTRHRQTGIVRRHAMARIAMQFFMRAVEFKFGPLVVIKTPDIPSVRVVTHGTRLSQTPLVFVVLLVASNALAAYVFIGRCQVTVLTGHDRVQAQKRKPRDVVIEPHTLAPGPLVVTILAALALLALVHIVHLVARMALEWQLVMDLSGVTSVARDLFMPTAQGVLGILAVVKADISPTLLGVAFLTLVAVPFLVRVVVSVTRNTFGLQLVMDFSGVT